MIITVLAVIGGITVAVVVFCAVGAWLMSGLKPGDVP